MVINLLVFQSLYFSVFCLPGTIAMFSYFNGLDLIYLRLGSHSIEKNNCSVQVDSAEFSDRNESWSGHQTPQFRDMKDGVSGHVTSC